MGVWITFKELPRRQSKEPTPERLVFAVTYGVKSSDLVLFCFVLFLFLFYLLCDLQHRCSVNLAETQFLTYQMAIKT